MIGYQTSPLADNQTNQIVIGHNAIGNGSNTTTIGNDSITATILKGNVSTLGTMSASSYITTSDINLKDVILQDGDVIHYKWKNKQDELIHIGYSAQEKRVDYPDAIYENKDGLLSVNYIEILVDKIRQLEKRIQTLEHK